MIIHSALSHPTQIPPPPPHILVDPSLRMNETVVSTIPNDATNESVCTLGSIKRLKPGVDKNGNDFKTMEEQKKLNTAKTTNPRKMKMERNGITLLG